MVKLFHFHESRSVLVVNHKAKLEHVGHTKATKSTHRLDELPASCPKTIRQTKTMKGGHENKSKSTWSSGSQIHPTTTLPSRFLALQTRLISLCSRRISSTLARHYVVVLVDPFPELNTSYFEVLKLLRTSYFVVFCSPALSASSPEF